MYYSDTPVTPHDTLIYYPSLSNLLIFSLIIECDTCDTCFRAHRSSASLWWQNHWRAREHYYLVTTRNVLILIPNRSNGIGKWNHIFTLRNKKHPQKNGCFIYFV